MKPLIRYFSLVLLSSVMLGCSQNTNNISSGSKDSNPQSASPYNVPAAPSGNTYHPTIYPNYNSYNGATESPYYYPYEYSWYPFHTFYFPFPYYFYFDHNHHHWHAINNTVHNHIVIENNFHRFHRGNFNPPPIRHEEHRQAIIHHENGFHHSEPAPIYHQNMNMNHEMHHEFNQAPRQNEHFSHDGHENDAHRR